MSDNLFKKLSFGILTLLNMMKPLSIPSCPSFLPQSPMVIPGKTMWFFLSLNGTMKACGPWFSPLTISYAQTTLTFEVLAAPPIQNFIASYEGEFKMNSLESWSYVAVVRMPLTFDPWASSVRAKQLRSAPLSILCNHWLCLSDPKFWMVLYASCKLTVIFTAQSWLIMLIGVK